MSGSIVIDRRSHRVTVTLTPDEAADLGRFLYQDGNDKWGKDLYEAARELAGWGDL